MEIYIFSQDGNLLTVLSESTGLISTKFRDELNNVASEPFVFTVDASVEYENKIEYGERNLTPAAGSFIGTMDEFQSIEKINVSPTRFVKEENRVIFKDKEGDYREYVIKEIDDIDNIDGPETTATCLPAFVDELNNHFVLDKRYTDKEAQLALNDALSGTRYTGIVEASLGLASTNFYHISSLNALWKILSVWGGDLKDVVEITGNKVTARKIVIKQRLGADNGARFEIDHNIEEIQRTILSYPKTAMYGWGASLETEGGGHSRYIDFNDVEWKVSNGDPVDKPKGQMWIGDPIALQQYGLIKDGQLLHRYGEFSNQDYEDPAELLWATWNYLQEAKKPEINYKLSVDLIDKDVSLGDTARAIDRQFARPIEIQTRVIAIEYDLLDIEGTAVVEMGQFLDLKDDRLERVIEDVEAIKGKQKEPITDDRFPDIKPPTPSNVQAIGGFQAIQLYWDFNRNIYISHYEVYGSQVKDFVPQPQHLLYRGKVSSFVHDAGTDQVWYYRIRGVNTRGTVGEFSTQVSAATVRVLSDDILFGPDVAAKLRELSENEPILAALSVKTMHIDNLAVDRFHLKYGIIDNVHIADAAIESAKIKSLNADKINVGTLRGHTLSAGYVMGSIITGTTIYVDGDRPDFLYSNAIDTNPNSLGVHIYLRPTAAGEVRATVTNTTTQYVPIRGSAFRAPPLENIELTTDNELRVLSSPGSSIYRDIRANILRGVALELSGQSDATNLYIRPALNGEVRFTGRTTTDRYIPIRALAYIAPTGEDAQILTDNELKVRNIGMTNVYRDVRAGSYYAENSNYYGIGNARLIAETGAATVRASAGTVYLQTSVEVRVTQPNSTVNYMKILASDFVPSSSERWKTNIEKYEGNALDLFVQSVIYRYLKHDSYDYEFGFIVERETPYEIIRGEGISSYSLQALTVKAVQELDTKLYGINNRLSMLELENQYLRQKIQQLEDKVA